MIPASAASGNPSDSPRASFKNPPPLPRPRYDTVLIADSDIARWDDRVLERVIALGFHVDRKGRFREGYPENPRLSALWDCAVSTARRGMRELEDASAAVRERYRGRIGLRLLRPRAESPDEDTQPPFVTLYADEFEALRRYTLCLAAYVKLLRLHRVRGCCRVRLRELAACLGVTHETAMLRLRGMTLAGVAVWHEEDDLQRGPLLVIEFPRWRARALARDEREAADQAARSIQEGVEKTGDAAQPSVEFSSETAQPGVEFSSETAQPGVEFSSDATRATTQYEVDPDIVVQKTANNVVGSPGARVLTEGESIEGDASDAIVAVLCGYDIPESCARRLVRGRDPARIRQQIDWLPVRIADAGQSGNPVGNPGGYLRRAIEEDWDAPWSIRARQEKDERAARAREARLALRARVIDPTPPPAIGEGPKTKADIDREVAARKKPTGGTEPGSTPTHSNREGSSSGPVTEPEPSDAQEKRRRPDFLAAEALLPAHVRASLERVRSKEAVRPRKERPTKKPPVPPEEENPSAPPLTPSEKAKSAPRKREQDRLDAYGLRATAPPPNGGKLPAGWEIV